MMPRETEMNHLMQVCSISEVKDVYDSLANNMDLTKAFNSCPIFKTYLQKQSKNTLIA